MSRKRSVFEKASKQALAMAFLLGCLPLNDCLAVGMPEVSARKALLQIPGYDKLTNGDGPTTHDGTSNRNGTAQPVDLSPLSLQGGQENIDSASVDNGADTVGGGVLKSSVSTTDYVSKQDNNQELQAKSVVGKGVCDSKTLVKQASSVGLGPVQLIESTDETDKKVDAILTAEQKELNELWEATLTRSPDIQFIVQKLQPTSNPAHLSTILTRMLSTAAFGGLGAMTMMSPNMGTYAMASAGGNLIQQALGMKESKNAKQAKLSQEEELVMFNMVRGTCDKLVGSYRDYKKNSTALDRASNDLQDLKAMVSDARSGQDAAKQLEMEYTLRKQQRDLDAIADEVRRHKQNLVDLAGPEAVAKLDKELIDEQTQVQQATAVADQTKPETGVAPAHNEQVVKTEIATTAASGEQSTNTETVKSSQDNQSAASQSESESKQTASLSPQS